MKLIYLLLSFFNFNASLRTAASLQAKKGCYRRPEPSSHTTNLPPRMILNTLTNAKWIYFQTHNYDQNRRIFVKRLLVSIYLSSGPF